MFHTQPPVAQRRNRRLPSGTMVSYAEVKNYLSKREIPQLFESLMAGLMYHRPENHIGYLQSCLDEVKTNSETKIHWSTFVNKKRKSKEILPPLTPKKQDSFNSSWSDNSRQSTPLPPISAKTVRTRGSPDQQQQDLRNTYILYHNPPPVLAKPKVPVISVLGGLGSKIDELCEKAVSRLRGVVHISTCSMLKTRMTIEGFYRVTSIPACAVVDSVLQAMSMVQSSNALMVAGFPRNRGDIEEYRSRRVRMDGVVLVDFEEDALRRFLKHEVSIGTLRIGDIENELEKYKQDIISVAEYYDEKELLTVVVGDQDVEEMVEDIIIAVEKVIEKRKDILDDDNDVSSHERSHECELDGPCKALLPSPEAEERPSTVEIRDATEEDIKAIEAETRNSAKNTANDDVQTLMEDTSNATEGNESSKASNNNSDQTNLPNEIEISSPEENVSTTRSKRDLNQRVPLLFAFENISTDSESLKDFIVSEKGMCFIDFNELVRNDDESSERFNTSDSINILKKVLKKDSVSYSNGFFISNFPFFLLKENKIEDIFKLGEATFICKIKEKRDEKDSDEISQEDLLFKSPLSDSIKIIFVTESNLMEELQSFLQELAINKTDESSNELPANLKSDQNSDSQETNLGINQNASLERSGDNEPTEPKSELVETNKEVEPQLQSTKEVLDPNFGLEEINQNSDKETTSRDDNEDSTCKDVEDLITDDTLLDGAKSSDILENEDVNKQENSKNTLSETSMERSSSAETLREKAVLARQDHLEIDSESISNASDNHIKDETGANNENDTDLNSRNKLTRQATFSSGQEPPTLSNDAQLPEVVMQVMKNNLASTQISNASESEKSKEGENDNKSETAEKNPDSDNGDNLETGENISNNKEDSLLELPDAVSDTDKSCPKSEEPLNDENSSANLHEKEEEAKEDNTKNSVDTSEEMVKASTNEENMSDAANEQNESASMKETDDNENEPHEENVANGSDNDESSQVSNLSDKTSENQAKSEEQNKNETSVSNDNANSDNIQESEDRLKDKNDDGTTVLADETGKPDEDSIEKEKLEKEVMSEIINVWPKLDANKIKEENSIAANTNNNEERLDKDEEFKNMPEEGIKDDTSLNSTTESEKKSVENSEVKNDAEDNSDEENNDEIKPDSDTNGNENSVKEHDNELQSETENDKEKTSLENKDDETENEKQNDDELQSKADSDTKENSENENGEEPKTESENANEQKSEEENSSANVSETELAENATEDDKVEENDAKGNHSDSTKNEDEAPNQDSQKDESNEENSETEDHKENVDGNSNKANENDETNDENKVEPEETEDTLANSSEKSENLKKSTTSEHQALSGNMQLPEVVMQAMKNNSSKANENKETNDEDKVEPEETEDTLANSSEKSENLEKSTNSDHQALSGNSQLPEVVMQVMKNNSINEQLSETKENGIVNATTIYKSVDNDSDSNDEKSITIETKAEVHAADSQSPSLDQHSEANEKKNQVNSSENEEERDTTNQTDLEEAIEKENGNEHEAISNADTAELSATTALEELNNLNNERYSGKYQERNGSGILGNNRPEDNPDAEEPQERSSSSSRGEL
ncbi:dentin sialophosphoprotein [Parasteatoda tepidariorum]|uniref:dentin sialophosphoprotein n=1 Tax=Parasteatoda tepidariorum TaxID=114398 RepID=UPI00077FDEF8|nr:uncharacterized protein DDB_G0290685 [Parasteatoda tepidariorum]